MNKIIKWGFIGLGNAAINLSKEFGKFSNIKISGIASKSKNKIENFKNKFKLQKKNIHDDYNKIICDKNIDIIYIALTNNFHKEYCIKAIKNNKNLLVEKPITTNLNYFNDIKELIKKNLIFEEGLAYRFHPFYNNVINSLKTIDKSQILSIKSSFGNDAIGGKKFLGIRFKKININKRLFNYQLGGGSILDGGIYPISLITDIVFSKYKNFDFDLKIISCKKKKISNGCDISASFKFKIDKIDISIDVSLEKKLRNYLEISTTKGNIIFENIFHIDEKSFIKKKINGIEQLIKCKNKNNSYYYQIKYLSNLIDDKKKIIDNFSENILKKTFNMKLLSKWVNH